MANSQRGKARASPLELRGRDVPPQERGFVEEITGEDSGPDEGNRDPTPTSQLENQGADQDTGATSNNTLRGSSDRGNIEPVNPKTTGEDTSLAGLTQAQRFRLLELDAEKQVAVEKTKLLELQLSRGHRREHSDDHYRDANRKRASVTRVPDKQSLTKYDSVVMFIRDCEDYFASSSSSDFRTAEEKTRWSSAILADSKKQTWRNDRDAILRATGEPTWEEYTDWCLNQVRNPAIRAHDVGRQLSKAEMKESQSVASFNDYLTKLWAQMDRLIADEERMETLRTRVVEKIPLEAMKEALMPTTYAALLQQYQSIEQRLRRMGDLPALDKSRPGDKTGSQGGSNRSHARSKTQHAKDRGKGASSSASQGAKPARTKPEDGGSAGKPKDLSNIRCYECGNMGHYKGDPACPKYVASNENRNQTPGKGKGKA